MIKLIHCSHCSVSKKQLSVASLCVIEIGIPCGEYLDFLNWINIARSCKAQCQKIGEVDFLLGFVYCLYMEGS